jgi:uncharacterized protein YdeI (YjbR/CyaY-like superfamily)
VSGGSNSASDATPVRRFRSRSDWAAWLEKNHRKSDGLWLRLAKKASGVQSVTYGEALEVALCYGWIDGQKNRDTDQTWLQKFCPRSHTSIWSKINRGKALTLIESGIMQPAGQEAVQRAKKNGCWRNAYDSPGRARVPRDLQAALDANPGAKTFFEGLDRQNRYAVLFRIQTVKKAETRARKIREFVEMLERNEKIHESGRPKRSRK